MSKNRLDESTIRRFMGLSGLAPLGESFIDRIREEEEELAPEPMPGEEAEPMPGEEAELGADAEMGAEPAADPAAAASEMATDVADAVADALSDVLGQHGVEVTSGEAGAEEPAAEEPALDAELPAEEPALDAEEPALEDEESALEEAGIELVDNDALVQEVARRVAARLVRESRTSTNS